MPTPPKTPPKPRTSSRSSRVRTPLLRFERLSRLWQRSRLAKFFLSIAALILLYIISYPIYQIAHHYQRVSIETKDYTTLSTTLKTLKPKLESVSPQGTVWEIEEYCSAGLRGIWRSLDSCSIYLSSSTTLDGGRTSNDAYVRQLAAILSDDGHIEVTAPLRSNSHGWTVDLDIKNATALNCVADFHFDKQASKFDSHIGCIGSAVKEYYPVRTN